MKYQNFKLCLTHICQDKASVGSCISIVLGSHPKISIADSFERACDPPNNPPNKIRFIIFPVKIYGNKIQHLNVLILDRKSKIVTRYEPFKNFTFPTIDRLIETLLYKLLNQHKIYFLKFEKSIKYEQTDDCKNCSIYCLQYVKNLIKSI